MKTIKLFIIAALATLMGGSLFSSCADDNDDFLSRNDKELSDLNKEDAAIRAELKKQIELTRTELNQKINTLETTLKKLIDDEGQSIYDQLATKMSQTKNLINEKFDGFEDNVDAKLPVLMGKLEQSGNKLDGILSTRKGQLATAIAEGDKQNEALIQAEIAKIGALQAKMAATKTRMETFETQIAQLEKNNAAILEIEQSVSQLQEKYKGQAAQFEKFNGQIRQMVNETIDNLTGQQLNTYNDQLVKAKALTDEMVEKLSDFEELSDRIEAIKSKYDEALNNNEATELPQKVEELESKFSDIENLMSDFENVPTAGDFNLDDISAPLDDMPTWSEDELTQLITVDPDAADDMIELLEGWAQDCAELLVKLEDLISEYNQIRDEMFE